MTIELTDAQLVERCRAGDADAWNELVERFSRYVYAISVRAFRLSEADAEDVFQEVFARTFERLDSLRDDAAIRPWLAQLTRNACVDRLRSGAREELTEDPDAEQSRTRRSSGSTRRWPSTRRCASSPATAARSSTASSPSDESYRSIGEALELPPARSRAASRAVSASCARSSREEKRTPTRLEISERNAPLRRGAPGRAARTASPAPAGWVQAAQELPEARRRLDEIVELARADAQFRARVIEDLEAALAAAGFTPEPALVDAVRARLPELRE